jgi:hypothetical protein
MLGQLPPPGAVPRAGGVVGVDVLGAVVGVFGAVEVDVAAFAIAAPPPATTAVTASVVSRGLILCRNEFHLLGALTNHTIPRLRVISVGGN